MMPSPLTNLPSPERQAESVTRSAFNFCEVTFANGHVQVVDFNETTRQAGKYKLLDFTNDRHVMTLRILAKSESDATKLAVYLGK